MIFNLEEQNNGDYEESIKINYLSVRLVRLSESQIEHYLNPNENHLTFGYDKNFENIEQRIKIEESNIV